MIWMFERTGKRNNNNKKYQFWQQHNQPIELNTNAKMEQKLDYLHNNPVAEGFVDETYEYKYSSAIDYSGGKSLINVEIID